VDVSFQSSHSLNKLSPFDAKLGIANPFGICGAQDRGRMFIQNKDEVFKDMIIGRMFIYI